MVVVQNSRERVGIAETRPESFPARHEYPHTLIACRNPWVLHRSLSDEAWVCQVQLETLPSKAVVPPSDVTFLLATGFDPSADAPRT